MHLAEWLTILLLGIASNLDNAGVGIAYGVQKIRIPWLQNLIVAFISFLATLCAGLFGHFISLWLSPVLGRFIGGMVIIVVGITVLIQPFLQSRDANQSHSLIRKILRNPEHADLNRNQEIGFIESVLLGIALAMNALVGGFDAGISKINVVATSISVGVLSYLLLGIAEYVGRKYAAERLGARATIVAGVLLVVIGIHQFF